MMELSLSAFAWAGVVLFQAIVHYTLRQKKRIDDDEPVLEASPLVLELAWSEPGDALQDVETLSRNDIRSAPQEHAFDEEFAYQDDDADETTLDGDEPPVFFELLSQTGCEMMRNISIESIALEQINEDERVCLSLEETVDLRFLKTA